MAEQPKPEEVKVNAGNPEARLYISNLKWELTDDDLKALFAFAPDTAIQVHPIRFGSGAWTAATGVMTGTFAKPMVTPDGKTIAPTGKRFAIGMATIGHWRKDGVMDHEWLFWDNQDFLKQIGLAQ